MINDRPTNISLNTVPAASGGKPAPKGVLALEKELAQAEQAKVNQKPEAKESVDVQDTKDKQPTVDAALLSKASKEELKEKVNQAIPKVRELMNKNQRSLDFKVAEKENRVIVTVIDKETDKVIRQIPPEDLLQLADSIDQGLNSLKEGSILNSKA